MASMMKFCEKFFNFFGLLACLSVMIVGGFGIFAAIYRGEFGLTYTDASEGWTTNINEGFATAELGLCIIMLALVGLAGELSIKKFLKYFFFLASFQGRGLYYIILGTLSFGVSGNLGMLLGAFTTLVGFFLLIFAICCQKCLHKLSYEEM
eukprot:TRINITY_DN4516_c1_g1_i1.p1 TRINITY_DN4516_c1_g1~~TRINITY_DN4516_c1_g1_i1.p1  ORF type:complete len:151 (+),score=46.41 TRINITY_DN4516_c1_g1_i1:122-574(+)